MHITFKHDGCKVEIMQQSNGIHVCKLFYTNGLFLRARTFPNIDQAMNFAVQWLHDMENSRVSEYDDMLHTWERSVTI